MIRVFVSDIDGCLSEPYRPFDLAGMTVLAGYATRADRRRVPEAPPDFSILTGRSYSYLEAVSQALSLRIPVLFEAGGGLFDPVSATTRWHPDFTPDLERELTDVKSWLATQIGGTSVSVDLGKRTQAGIIGPDEEEITQLKPVVRDYVERSHPGLVVLSTGVSIDVMGRHLTKKRGIAWLADELRVDPGEMAFIGDTEGDLGALSVVGRSFAPANASPEVKGRVQTVTRGRVLDGVIEAYRACVNENSAPADPDRREA